ncbi:MAG: hypothetical protein QOF43_1326, partial [Gaiellaceae bacterium]|nr:hypothetical protein [Gaiellaceae bacterium]
MRGVLLKGFAALAILLLVPAATAGAGPHKRVPASKHAAAAPSVKRAVATGVTPGVVSDLTWGISSADQDRTIAAMKDAGVRWTRLSIQWKAWQPKKDSFAQWELDRTDRAVRLCRAAGIHVLIDVLNAPGW